MIVSALTFCTTSRPYSFIFLEKKARQQVESTKIVPNATPCCACRNLISSTSYQESGYKYSWLLRTNKITRKIKPGVRSKPKQGYSRFNQDILTRVFLECMHSPNPLFLSGGGGSFQKIEGG